MAFCAGTELGLAVDAAKELEKDGKKIRVVSLVSWELFEEQGKEYKASILLHLCRFQPMHAECVLFVAGSNIAGGIAPRTADLGD